MQIVCGCRPAERLSDVQARVSAALDSLAPTWRDELRWSRRLLLGAATGAIDLPGRTWRDRPRLVFADGVYRSGDYLAAPGLLSEVSFVSGREAGKAAALYFRRRHAVEPVRRNSSRLSPPTAQPVTDDRSGTTESAGQADG